MAMGTRDDWLGCFARLGCLGITLLIIVAGLIAFIAWAVTH